MISVKSSTDLESTAFNKDLPNRPQNNAVSRAVVEIYNFNRFSQFFAIHFRRLPMKQPGGVTPTTGDQAMQLDLSETLIPIDEVSKHLPKGVSVSVYTIRRWIDRGSRGCRLKTISVGGQRFTTVALIREFIIETTMKTNGQSGHVALSRDGLAGGAIGSVKMGRAIAAGT